jgi:hypothetical protein
MGGSRPSQQHQSAPPCFCMCDDSVMLRYEWQLTKWANILDGDATYVGGKVSKGIAVDEEG